MEKRVKLKAYGTAVSKEGNHNFSGEVISVSSESKGMIHFYYDYKSYMISSKKCEPIDLLYPNYVYIKEGGSSLNIHSGVVEVESTEISNCYARRGSHWIKYTIEPRDLKAISEEDDEPEDQIDPCADMIVDIEEFKYNLFKNGFSKESILNIINLL